MTKTRNHAHPRRYPMTFKVNAEELRTILASARTQGKPYSQACREAILNNTLTAYPKQETPQNGNMGGLVGLILLHNIVVALKQAREAV